MTALFTSFPTQIFLMAIRTLKVLIRTFFFAKEHDKRAAVLYSNAMETQ